MDKQDGSEEAHNQIIRTINHTHISISIPSSLTPIRTLSHPFLPPMSLLTHNGSVGGGLLYTVPTNHPSYTHRSQLSLIPSPPNKSLHIVSASKKFSSRTGRFDGKNRRNSTATKEDQDEKNEGQFESGGAVESSVADDGFVMPKLPGEEPDFWEGEQWDALGFFVQYMWAFGILFALIASGFAVATYNEGATDFKETPTYKESIQSQELLEEPDASNSDVFESNPTEVAPSLE